MKTITTGSRPVECSARAEPRLSGEPSFDKSQSYLVQSRYPVCHALRVMHLILRAPGTPSASK